MAKGMSDCSTKSLQDKLLDLSSCGGLCNLICECCFEKKSPKLTKDDIRHLCIVEQQPDSPTVIGLWDEENRQLTEGPSRMTSASSTSAERTDSYSPARSNSRPMLDIRPIEFWTSCREVVQPRRGSQRRRINSESEISAEAFQPELYAAEKTQTPDSERLARFSLGELHFSVQYLGELQLLRIRIIEARDLPFPITQDSARTDLAHSNPYIRLCLVSDDRNSQQTTVQRKTQNPLWEESFTFEIKICELEDHVLQMKVMDFDKFSCHCLIGEVNYPLDQVDLLKGLHLWKPLTPGHKEDCELGELLVSVKFLPSAGRLNVDVMKARQLLQTDLVGGSDPYVRVTLCVDERICKTKKTSVKKNTIDPIFNESVSFNVNSDSLPSTSVVITVWDYNSKSRDDFVGRIVLGKIGSGRGEEQHWQQLEHTLRAPVAQWHRLRSRQHCDLVAPHSFGVN